MKLNIHVGTTIGTKDHIIAIRSLRRQCVEYMRERMDDFRFIILYEICGMKRWNIEDVPEAEHEDMISNYLSSTLLDGEWCGSEMMSAVIRLYNVDITVYTKNADPIRFAVPDPTRRINLYFNGGPPENHYDLVLKVEEIHNDQINFLETQAFSTTPYTRRKTLIGTTRNGTIENTSNEAETLFLAVIRGWLGDKVQGWQQYINVLNIRRATIKELSTNATYYIPIMENYRRRGLSQEQWSDLITHWKENGKNVEPEACVAVANILSMKIRIYTADNEILTFEPSEEKVSIEICIIEEMKGIFILKNDQQLQWLDNVPSSESIIMDAMRQENEQMER